MSDRELALQAVQDLPKEATLAQIIDELRLLETVRHGVRDIESGALRGVPHEEAEKLIRKWVTESSGRTAA